MVYPIIDPTAVGWVSEAEMIEVDRVMIDDLGIGLIQMMENAGRHLARVAIDVFDPAHVWVAAGSGGNGGGGLVAARHLANSGVAVTVSTTRPPAAMTGVPGRQVQILTAMGVPMTDDAPHDADLTIDALIGYSLRGAPRGRSAELIDAVNRDTPTLALDTPSGLDVTTGSTPGVVVDADATMTLALPKAGLRVSRHAGRLFLADISVPRSVTGPLGGAPDFRASSIVRIAAEATDAV